MTEEAVFFPGHMCIFANDSHPAGGKE